MSRPIKIVVIVALLAGGLQLLRYLARDADPSDERQLLLLVDQLAAAVEAKEIKTVRQHIAPGYEDESGRRAEDLSRLLALLLLRQGQISVYVLRSQVEVERGSEPPTAHLQVTALMTRGPRLKQLSDLLPESARALAFELRLIKQEDRWQLTRAAWTDVPNWQALIR